MIFLVFKIFLNFLFNGAYTIERIACLYEPLIRVGESGMGEGACDKCFFFFPLNSGIRKRRGKDCYLLSQYSSPGGIVTW